MWELIKKFNILLSAKQKGRIIFLFVVTLLGACFEVLGVSLIIPLFSVILKPEIINTNRYAITTCELLGISSHKSFLLYCIASMIFVFIAKNMFLLYEYYAQARFVYDSRFETQQRLMHAFLCKPYEYFLNASSGEIMRIVLTDVEQTYQLLLSLTLFLSELVFSLALISFIFYVDPLMTCLLVLLLFFIVVVVSKIIKPILTTKGHEFRSNMSKANNWLMQSIHGLKEIKIAGNELYFERHFEESGKIRINAEKWNNVFNNMPKLLLEMGCVCATLLAFAIMIFFDRDVNELLPTLGAIAMTAVRLMPAGNRMFTAANYVAYCGPAIDNVISNLKVLDAGNANHLESKNSLVIEKQVELVDICYKYPNTDRYVLKDANMVIPVGKSIGIMGASGAGKTTAIDVMLGLLSPESGKILADGVDVMTDYSDWLSHIGYIPQTIFMLDETIRENIAFGREIDDEKVWDALREAQLEDFVKTLPQGLDTGIGERGIRLSGGQRQRIGIARALYNNPDILVFDEATSSLDNETEEAIIESIDKLHGKKTLVIIAHRLHTIEGCDILYKVNDGKISKGSL